MGRTLVMSVVMFTLAMGTAHGQQCLHGPAESAEQAARRTEAVNAARTINNIQANHGGLGYFRYQDLASSPFAVQMRQSPSGPGKRISLVPGTDILPGWTLMLDVAVDHYWFMIKDKTDPCGFAIVSNQTGLIYTAEPAR